MLKIHGSDISFPVLRVRYVTNFLGLEHEYRKIDVAAGENRTPEYLKLHPAGKIPVITDGDFVLFESNAIIKYLAQKNKSSLYPQDLKQRAIIDQWMDFVAIHVGGGIGKVLFNKVIAPKFDMEVDERSLKDGISFLERFLPIIDAQLGKTKNLASTELSLADFTLLATVDPLEAIQLDTSAYPKLMAWRENLRKQDFYQKVHKFYGEAMMAKS